MGPARRSLLAVATMLIVATAGVSEARAHDGEAGLVVEPGVSWPGGAVVVRADLPTTNAVELVLRSRAGRVLPLTTVRDPGQGHFEAAATVPSTATAGEWEVIALVATKALGRVPLTITAAPAAGVEDDRAEPVPGSPPLPGPAATPARAAVLGAEQPTGTMSRAWLAVPAALVLAAGGLVLRRRRPDA